MADGGWLQHFQEGVAGWPNHKDHKGHQAVLGRKETAAFVIFVFFVAPRLDVRFGRRNDCTLVKNVVMGMANRP
jgi:hypothetical protein